MYPLSTQILAKTDEKSLLNKDMDAKHCAKPLLFMDVGRYRAHALKIYPLPTFQENHSIVTIFITCGS